MPELLFVYNANAGLLNGLLDTLHKTLSPATYACTLCAVTYGATHMRPEWRAFLEALPAKTHFLHRDELLQHYPHLGTEPLPAVFRRASSSGMWQVVIPAEELQTLDLPALMEVVRRRI